LRLLAARIHETRSILDTDQGFRLSSDQLNAILNTQTPSVYNRAASLKGVDPGDSMPGDVGHIVQGRDGGWKFIKLQNVLAHLASLDFRPHSTVIDQVAEGVFRGYVFH
jgi:hypothetical protein